MYIAALIKTITVMKKLNILLISLLLLVACDNKKVYPQMEGLVPCQLDLNIDSKDGLSDDFILTTDYLNLDEPQNTFSIIDKMIMRDGVIYIFDRMGKNTLISFNMQGEYKTTFGCRGNSASEYLRLWDFDVDKNYVYLYDYQKKKILYYSLGGKFIKSKDVDFYANGFNILDNGDFLFSLSREIGEEKLCLMDSDFKKKEILLKYESKDKANRMANNFFQKVNDTIIYNCPVSDDIYLFSCKDGKPLGAYTICFDGKNIPNEKKYDYEKLSSSGERNKYLFIRDCPFLIKDKLIMPIFNKGKKSMLYFNFSTKNGGLKNLGEKTSCKDVIFPLFADDIYCLGWIDQEIYSYIQDKDKIPQDVVNHIKNGNRSIVFYQLKQ